MRRALRLRDSRFMTIPNGAAIAAPAADVAEDPCLVVSVGRLHRYKGHQYAIAAMPYVLQAMPGVRLRIVGSGPYESELRQLAADLGVDHSVEIGGAVGDRAAMATLLKQAALVVLLSEYESQGIAAMEALALQRRLLVANTTALGDLAAKGWAAGISPHASPDKIAAAMLRQLTGELPPSLDLPSWDDCADKLGQLYRSVLGRLMRVLMLTDLYPPFIGGIEQHVRNLSHGLVERGHEVTVATMSVDGQPARQDDEGVRVVRLRGSAQRLESYTSPAGSPHAPPFPDPEVVAGLRDEIRRCPPDVVHGHNWMLRSFVPLKRGSRAGLVYTLHDYGVVCAKRSFVYHGLPCSGPGPLKCLECAGRNYGAARGAAIATGNWLMRPAERSVVDMFMPVSSAVPRGNELVEQALPHEVVPNFVPDDVAAEN